MLKFALSLLLTCSLTVIALGWRFPSTGDDRVQRIPDTATDPAPDIAAPLMMQTKLTASQRVLEGLLNRDFDQMTASAQLLKRLAELAPPRRHPRIDQDVYAHFRTEFVRLAGQLEAMGDEENLPGAAYVHQELTATCIACHDHLRDGQSP